MQKNIALLLILGFFGTLNAQDKTETLSVKGINFLTDFYYNQSNWVALKTLEPAIKANDSLQPHVYSRLGQSFYFSNDFVTAEKYLKKANSLNSDETTLYFYYYAIYFQGYSQEANQLKNKMSPKMVQQIEGYTPVSTLESVSFEGGIKSLKEKDIGGNLNYVSISTSWNLNHSLKLNLGFNYLSQEINSASYTQPEYYISLPWALGNGWTFTSVFHGLTNDDKYISDPENKIVSNKLGFIQGGINKRINQLNLGINIGTHFLNSTLSSTTKNETTKENTLQLGFSGSYLFQFGPEFYYLLNPNFAVLTQNAYGIITNGNALNISNSFFWGKWSLLTSYLTKDEQLYADNLGSYYFNAEGSIKNRYSISIGANLSTHFETLITYQKELQATTTYPTINYNSIFLTLKYKL